MGLRLSLLAGCAPGNPAVDAPAVDVSLPTADAAAACGEPPRVNPSPPAAPPYSGTVFIDPDLMTAADPTSFVGVVYKGQGQRTMFDRRTNSFNLVNAHLFDATFGASTRVEVQVNPEISRTDAEIEAARYATVIGRMPAFLFRDLDTVWIHRGLNPFGGGNRNLLIHTEQGAQYIADGFLEEVFLHEAAHTSLDAHHASAADWVAAQAADRGAISDYARDNPMREDVAESLGPYLAQRFWIDRMAAADIAKIRGAIPARIAYFDCLQLSAAARLPGSSVVATRSSSDIAIVPPISGR